MDDGDLVRSGRWICASLWMLVLAAALAGMLLGNGRGQLIAFVAAVVVTIVTAVMAKLARDERLAYPVAYRIAAGALLAVALAGVVLALVPHASEASRIAGVFFGLVSLLAYRAVVARGPRTAMFTVVIAMWAWLPIGFITLIGCKCGPHFVRVPHATEVATWVTLRVLLLLLPVLAGAALLAFAPRRDFMPDARVVR